MPSTTTTPDAAPSVFLSHSHKDRSFARRLAADLRNRSVAVWIDEREIEIGDSLLHELTRAIEEVDFLAVVISPNSASSDWVAREIEFAEQASEGGHRVTVLPILLRGGELPEPLSGRIYADFTSPYNYSRELEKLLTRLGIGAPEASAVGRLEELAAASPILASALRQLRAEGLLNTTVDAMIAARIDDFDLSEFLSLAAHETLPENLFGLAIGLLRCIDERSAGHDALDYCLQAGNLSEAHLVQVGLKMQYVTTSQGVTWCHNRLTSVIRSDTYYNSFLNKHSEEVLANCFDEMLDYLLEPDRGPAGYNIDSFAIVVQGAEDPRPFQRRWIEWIDDGLFDDRDLPGSEDPDILYKILNEQWEAPAFRPIMEAIHSHVHGLLKSHSTDRIDEGFTQLGAMIDARYLGAERTLSQTVTRVYNLDPERRALLGDLGRALETVAALNADPSNATLEKRVTDAHLKLRWLPASE